MRDKLRDFGKTPRFDLRDFRVPLNKIVPPMSKEDAEAMLKRFFDLWPEAARYVQQLKETKR